MSGDGIVPGLAMEYYLTERDLGDETEQKAPVILDLMAALKASVARKNPPSPQPDGDPRPRFVSDDPEVQ